MISRAMSLSVTAAAEGDSALRSVKTLTRDMARLREDAWTEFHARYFDRLLRYAITLHRGNRARAEDSVQSGFIRVVRHIRRFDNEDTFWSWLTLLIRCAATDEGRKIAAHTRLQEALVADVPLTPAHSPSQGTIFVLLEEALGRLDPQERRLLDQKYTEGQTTAALAASRNLTEKAIENRLRRLRHHLKAELHALAKHTSA